jgi:CubicO group peptidase (beta-lactamase class C family)
MNVVVVILSLAAALMTPHQATPNAAPAAGATVRDGAGTPLPPAAPESQGISPDRLSRLHGEIQRFVTDGKHAGAIVLLARNGRIVDWQAYGKRDIEAGLPMEKDTICRIYSMSKIITSVAVLTLLEEARFRLDDPIADYLPQFARMKVLTGGTADKPLLADAQKPITIRHLLTHTSGLTYGFGDGTLDKIFQQVKPFEASSMSEFVERMSRLPLAHEPGERFTYGVSIDVLGALIEKVSGRSLGEFLDERICRPLGMKDTAFNVPESKRNRLAKVYEKGPDGSLRPVKRLLEQDPAPVPKILSGGGGLFSTTGDYARFMQMLLNGGEIDGVRILSRKTVELMMTNQLSLASQPFRDGNPAEGFGLGGALRIDLAKGSGLGSVGQFGWTGMATTYASLDPQEKIVALLFVQHLPYDEFKIFWRFSTLSYAAIAD